MSPRLGILLLALISLGLLLGVTLLDLYFEYRRWRPIALRVERWSRRYPFFAAGLAAVFGALLGHFFWQ